MRQPETDKGIEGLELGELEELEFDEATNTLELGGVR